ncbi:MAG: sigma-70 family RNA polymerase sigma factor [Mariprofundaceae bacterium]
MKYVNEPGDEELMLRYKDGSAEAFVELYARHKGPLYRYMLRSCESKALAEELYQDAWTGVIKGRSRYNATAKFSTWLYSIASHRLIDHYRKQGRWNEYLVDDDGEACAVAASFEQPEAQADINQQMQRLLYCLEQLPPPQRQVFLLKEEAGMTINAIASSIGIGLEAAKSRMRYALGKLRLCMGGEA